MMISIGHKNFLETSCIDEILTPHGPRAARLKQLAAEVGMLISATEGKRVKSMIKLKTKHIVLSSLEPETIRSKLDRLNSGQACATRCSAGHSTEKSVQENRSEASAAGGRTRGTFYETFPWAGDDEPRIRSGIERRRFSYTCHIPERRSGGDRRKCQ